MPAPSPPPLPGSPPIPLVVDLDGTLVHTDLLVESALVLAKSSPLSLARLPSWLAAGKASLKANIAARAQVDVDALPYCEPVLTMIEAARQEGRPVVLATASDLRYATQIADSLQLFDQVFATHDGINLSAEKKRDALVRAFGEGGFDYAGNSQDDLVVWQAARHAIVVNADESIVRAASAQGNVEQVIDARPARADGPSAARAWLRALRLHQWLKNLLVFVPLLASHQAGDPEMLWHGVIAFLCFGLCASSVYVVNDLLDLADDRHHPTKRRRPFAAGTLPIVHGLIGAPLCLTVSVLLSLWLLPIGFSLVLAVYFAVTLAYSFVLKRWMIVDVITLAMLYTLRLIAGTFAFDAVLTGWMLAFSMFIFLSLALIKRYTELRIARESGERSKTRGRGYFPEDIELIASMGTSSGYIAVLVLALYVQDDSTVMLYRHPQMIWLACPLLLFWISRAWLIAHRGHMHEDPVVFAAKDRISLLIGALFGLIFWLAA
ncbi:MAG: UbiA family prenyltransferase [Burkholderiaceae bacterium]